MIRPWTVALLACAALPSTQADTPGPAYAPVFNVPAPAEAPAQDWREANDTVGRFPRGHIDLLRWEQQHPGKPEPAPPAQAGEPLTLERALALAWAREPGVFVLPGTSPAEQALAQTRAAQVAHETRQTWFMAVAAEAALRHRQAAWEAADTGAELARRMQRVGNWTAAQATAEQQLRLATGTELVRARVEAQAARERLGLLLGQPAARAALPQPLPEPPATLPALAELETLALRRHPQLVRQRLDSAREQAAASPAALEQARARLLAVAQAATASPLDPAAVPDLRLEPRTLPGWNHATERALLAQTRTEALADTVRAQVREAWLRLRAAHEIDAVSRSGALAAAELQMQDGQQRYNGMLASTWDLLARSRELVHARRAAEEARLGYWLAHNDLLTVLAGGGYRGPAAPASAGGPTPSTPAH